MLDASIFLSLYMGSKGEITRIYCMLEEETKCVFDVCEPGLFLCFCKFKVFVLAPIAYNCACNPWLSEGGMFVGRCAEGSRYLSNLHAT